MVSLQPTFVYLCVCVCVCVCECVYDFVISCECLCVENLDLIASEESWHDPLSKESLRDPKLDFWYNNADIYMMKRVGAPVQDTEIEGDFCAYAVCARLCAVCENVCVYSRSQMSRSHFCHSFETVRAEANTKERLMMMSTTRKRCACIPVRTTT